MLCSIKYIRGQFSYKFLTQKMWWSLLNFWSSAYSVPVDTSDLLPLFLLMQNERGMDFLFLAANLNHCQNPVISSTWLKGGTRLAVSDTVSDPILYQKKKKTTHKMSATGTGDEVKKNKKKSDTSLQKPSLTWNRGEEKERGSMIPHRSHNSGEGMEVLCDSHGFVCLWCG